MRLAASATVCVLAAFGAAFLVTRAVGHQGSARVDTPTVAGSEPAAPVARATTTTTNAELAAQFTPAPQLVKLTRRRTLPVATDDSQDLALHLRQAAAARRP